MSVCVVMLLALGTKPPDDPRFTLLEAMASELERSRAALRLNGDKGPYFIAYQVKDTERREIAGRYGALFQNDSDRDRRLSVDVRVGDYDYDSSVADEFDFNFSGKGTSFIPQKNGPLDDSPAALRTALWLVTDEKYKAALSNYLKKKGEDVYSVEDPKRPPSFSRESRAVVTGPKVPFPFARDRWAALARGVSAALAARKELLDSEVRVSATKTIRLYANTEGSRLITEQALYGVHIQAWTRAEDGQLLENSRDWYAPAEAQLPSDARIRSDTEQMTRDLLALRGAPTIDPYTGPAILEPDAAGVLFHEAVGHRLEGERQGNDTEGKTFRGQVGKRVLPSFLSIIDDPTAASRSGIRLNGHYLFDEEGVPAQPVTLVQGGVLKAFLLSRKPVEGFLNSNGHGRAQGGRKPVARMANLIVESSKRMSNEALKARLVAEARRQGKPFGLIIRDITGGNTNTTTFGYQAFKGTPRMVVRVDVDTGEETLVRGVEIVGTPLSSVNRVLATSDVEGVFNGFCGAESGMVPVSTVAPSVLLEEIELQRAVEGKDRPPLIESPFGAPSHLPTGSSVD